MLIRDVAKAACGVYRIGMVEILGDCRLMHIVEARHVVSYLATRRLGAASNKVGRIMGRDHSTVLHGRQRIEMAMRFSPEIAERVEKVWSKALGVVPVTASGGATAPILPLGASSQPKQIAARPEPNLGLDEIRNPRQWWQENEERFAAAWMEAGE